MSKGGTLSHTLEKSLTLTHGFIKTRHLYWCLRVTYVGNKVPAVDDFVRIIRNAQILVNVWTKWGAFSVKPGGTFLSEFIPFCLL